MDSVVSGASQTAGLSHPSKGTFLPEGKMNKLRPCTAASKESSKKAG
jgi:hypothetical protein